MSRLVRSLGRSATAYPFSVWSRSHTSRADRLVYRLVYRRSDFNSGSAWVWGSTRSRMSMPSCGFASSDRAEPRVPKLSAHRMPEARSCGPVSTFARPQPNRRSARRARPAHKARVTSAWNKRRRCPVGDRAARRSKSSMLVSESSMTRTRVTGCEAVHHPHPRKDGEGQLTCESLHAERLTASPRVSAAEGVEEEGDGPAPGPQRAVREHCPVEGRVLGGGSAGALDRHETPRPEPRSWPRCASASGCNRPTRPRRPAGYSGRRGRCSRWPSPSPAGPGTPATLPTSAQPAGSPSGFCTTVTFRSSCRPARRSPTCARRTRRTPLRPPGRTPRRWRSAGSAGSP